MLHQTWKSYNFFNTALRRSFFCVKSVRVVDTSGSSMRYVLARSAAVSLPSARPLIKESCNSFAMERRKSWSMMRGMLSIMRYKRIFSVGRTI